MIHNGSDWVTLRGNEGWLLLCVHRKCRQIASWVAVAEGFVFQRCDEHIEETKRLRGDLVWVRVR